MDNPWKTLKSDLIYDNPWIKVTEHQIINPSGQPGIYGTIHFKYLAVGVLPVDREGFTYLVGQYRYPLKQYSWEIPEGGGLLNVPAVDTAKRELKEETGITAGTWKKILEMDLSNSVTDEKAVSFLATDLSFGESAPEDDEQLQIKKVKLSDAYEMVISGEIRDAISVATILRVKDLNI